MIVYNTNNLPKEDFLVVSLEKHPGFQYLLSVNSIKDTMYQAYYNFEKSKNLNNNIFYFCDKETNKSTFEYFYNNYIKQTTWNEISLIDNELDYLGVKEKGFIYGVNNFINQEDEEIFLCSMKNYYKIADVDFGEYIIPFNMISLETEGIELIIWSGIRNNLFVACDAYCGKLSSLYNFCDDDFEMN